jgi:5'-methylthioadenosine phosphorylase
VAPPQTFFERDPLPAPRVFLPPPPRARFAIIGGSGVYDPALFTHVKRVNLHTPYGATSDEIEVGQMGGLPVAFLSRHGRGHKHPPHRVPYRANLWALKQLGVERIVSPCAVGSLQEKIKPGDIVLVDQFIDQTKKRDLTFFDGPQTVHISTADPFCPELRETFASAGKRLKLPLRKAGTYLCIEGPRFSTRAESRMFRQFADVIGMTLVPEAQLARELEMCYLSIATSTDYDVWADRPVSVEEILRVLGQNVENSKRLIQEALPKIPKRRACPCRNALQGATF